MTEGLYSERLKEFTILLVSGFRAGLEQGTTRLRVSRGDHSATLLAPATLSPEDTYMYC